MLPYRGMGLNNHTQEQTGNKIREFVNSPKILLVLIPLLIIFHKYLVPIVLTIVFTIMGVVTLRVTKFIPFISVETISATAILYSGLWGWKAGFFFGLGVGIFGAAYSGFLKLTTMINAVLMGVCGLAGAFFFNLGYSFHLTFFLTYLIRSNLGFVIYQVIKPDIFENILHSYGDALYNILIVSQLMYLLFKLLGTIG